jgi:hypothetical protein
MPLANSTNGVSNRLRVAGGALAALGGLLLALWLNARDTDRDGAIFVLGGGAVFALIGGAIWTIGYSIALAARRRR